MFHVAMVTAGHLITTVTNMFDELIVYQQVEGTNRLAVTFDL